MPKDEILKIIDNEIQKKKKERKKETKEKSL